MSQHIERAMDEHAPAKQMPYLERTLSLSPDGRASLFAQIDHRDDEVVTVV